MAHVKSFFRYILGGVLVFTGVSHFTNADFFVPMLDGFLPYPRELVYASGVAEIVCGLLVAMPWTQVWGGWAVIALMVAVFPANIRMALEPELFSDYGSPTAMLIRLPLQIIPIVWAYWYTRKPATAPASEPASATSA